MALRQSLSVNIPKDSINPFLVFHVACENGDSLSLPIVVGWIGDVVVQEELDLVEGQSSKEGHHPHDLVRFSAELPMVEPNVQVDLRQVCLELGLVATKRVQQGHLRHFILAATSCLFGLRVLTMP